MKLIARIMERFSILIKKPSLKEDCIKRAKHLKNIIDDDAAVDKIDIDFLQKIVQEEETKLNEEDTLSLIHI